ncbi:VOC family protein [Terracidiphilus gabretensis]|uniref:VOC family protein n=1 Tax=Terracidiphilus gabretensis TaxID=1577687 RepID=UPI00071C0617|nr:VOC family protein [Terracidiphilus gabretensis]
MSYIALATDSFNDVAFFYGELLGFPVVAEWDRPNGRGRRYDLGGLTLEILDNSRERQRLDLYNPGERTHIVVEVDDLEALRRRLQLVTPNPQNVSWGARLFQLRDPDGIPVTFLEWMPLS